MAGAQGLDVTAQVSGAQYAPPASNPALDLARSLTEIRPEAQGAINAVGDSLQSQAQIQAKKDAMAANGAKYADAVQQGKILPTQNPWYMQAYNRESAAISSQQDLYKLQNDAATWPEANDPQQFQQRWQQGVADIGKNYSTPDENAGFMAAASQVTQQTIASNQAENVQRIVAARTTNVSALAADSLVQAMKQTGGTLSGTQAYQAMSAAHLRWTATGGSEEQWNKIVFDAVTAAGYSTGDSGVIDLLKDPALLGQPPTAGADGSSGAGPGAMSAPGQVTPPSPGQGAALRGTENSPTPQAFDETAAHNAVASLFPGSTVTSMARSAAHNATLPGAATNSMHLTAEAIDFEAPGMTPAQVKAKWLAAGHPLTEFITPAEAVANGEGAHYHIGWRGAAGQTTPTQQLLASYPGGPPTIPSTALAATGTSTASSPNSLYNQAGIAEQAETIRYRIQQNAFEQAQDKYKNLRAAQELEGQQATQDIYSTFGNGVITGGADPNAVVSYLSSKGYSPAGIAAAMANIHENVAASVGLQNAKRELYSANPQNAAALFNLDLEGKKNGWTPDYEQRVGAQVVAGNITGEDGQRMILGAVEKSKQDGQAVTASGVHNYEGLRNHAESLAQTIAFQTTRSYGVQMDDITFKQTRENIATAGGAYLESHPGDFAGSYQAMAAETARELSNLRKANAGQKPRPTLQTSTGSPQPAPADATNPRRPIQ